jgi:sugar-specific transcriptional regulator TrmB
MARGKPPAELLETLEQLGLTGSEAAVYAHLVRHSPATGYGVAQAIDRPVANTYKTLASLEAKGAVVVDDSGSRLCRAVPPEEFLARLERQFRDRRARAASALEEIRRAASRERGGGDDEDPRVYRLHSRAQVIARARFMLERATRCALVDIFPNPLKELAEDLDRAAARGIDVVVKAYADTTLSRAVLVPILAPERKIPGAWPGHHLNVVVDASVSLLALLKPDGDGVFQAVSTASPYLAAVQHSGLQFEFMMTHVRDGIYKKLDADALHQIVLSYIRFSLHQMPGYKALMTGARAHNEIDAD